MQDQPLSNVSSVSSEKPPYISCLLACLALLYVTHLSLFPLFDLFGLCALAAFCVLYSVLFVTSDIRFVPLAPTVCALSLAVRGFLSGFTTDIAAGFVNLIFAVLAALALYVCTSFKASKSVCFAVLCVCFAALLASHAVFLIFNLYGSFSFEILSQAIDALDANVGEMFATLTQNLSSPASLTGAVPTVEPTQGNQQLLQTLVVSVRASIPSFAVCFAMIGSALTLLIYRPIIRALHAEKMCLEGRNWRFSVSTVSVIMFYVSYIVYFITGLSSQSGFVFAAFMNLSTILTYPFAWLGLRFLYALLYAKTKSKAAGVGILAVGLLLIGMFLGLGGLLFTLLAFIGASAQFNENIRGRFEGLNS